MDTSDLVARIRDSARCALTMDAEHVLQEAADYIERLEERCAAYKGQVEYGAAEIEMLKGALALCAKHSGGHADGATTDFLMHVPENVRLHAERLTRERDEARNSVAHYLEGCKTAEATIAALRLENERLLEAIQRDGEYVAKQDKEIGRLKEIVAGFVAMIEDSMSGLIHPSGGKFVAGVTDLELRPDGSLKLSDARAALKQEPKT